MSFAESLRRTVLVTVLVAGCASVTPDSRETSTLPPVPVAPFALAPAELDDEVLAAHVLNRLAFGPRAGDVQRVVASGVDRWIDHQLTPTRHSSPALPAVPECAYWSMPLDSAVASYPNLYRRPESTSGLGTSLRLVTRAAARARGSSAPASTIPANLVACRLARVERSERQLQEVMIDFWHNHFSLYGPSLLAVSNIIDFDRAAIAPHALGRFRDLLGAAARSPAILHYLDNHVSTADSTQPTLREHLFDGYTHGFPLRRVMQGMNENFARELMELHTMGADGGYTQDDVINVARAFTGWTHSGINLDCEEGPIPGTNLSRICRRMGRHVTFVFDSAAHDAGEKRVLGHSLPAGRGIEDGQDVLDILAAHPSTARHIARKLAVRFIADAPPDSLVDRAAAAYLRSGGDIAITLRAILESPVFVDPATVGAKVKSPLELVLSLRRALDVPADTAAEVIDMLIGLDQVPWGWLAPDGWPETGEGWINTGSLLRRIDFARDVAAGVYPSLAVDIVGPLRPLLDAPYEEQVDGVLRVLLPGRPVDALRVALLEEPPAGSTAVARARALRNVVALVVGSLEFQRR